MIPSFQIRKNTFLQAGNQIAKIANSDHSAGFTPAQQALFDEIKNSISVNPWFTEDNVREAFKGIVGMLEPSAMDAWLSAYPKLHKDSKNPLTIAVIMAGNIPFVGFHDMLCVILAGHKFLGKLSSQDNQLPRKVADLISEIEPETGQMITFSEGIIDGFDAVIATGSNNSSRYFDYYFGKYPHIIRRNRNSIAVLSGNETESELDGIAADVFQYFGMGCRNVSLLFVPQEYDFSLLLESFGKWKELQHHGKYYNNYEYQKAVAIINNIEHTDIGFSILVREKRLTSPLAVLHYAHYSTLEEIEQFISGHKDEIQCVVASGAKAGRYSQAIHPGNTQRPEPSDYADGVDVMAFLSALDE